MKGWQKILQERRKTEWEQEQRRQIEENIDKRYAMIKTNQEKMIASLLNRPYKKLVLDRYMEQREKESVLEIEPETVKRGVAAHYEDQFRKRATRLEEMSKKWKNYIDLGKTLMRNGTVK